jgi:hypothetical protein
MVEIMSVPRSADDRGATIDTSSPRSGYATRGARRGSAPCSPGAHHSPARNGGRGRRALRSLGACRGARSLRSLVTPEAAAYLASAAALTVCCGLLATTCHLLVGSLRSASLLVALAAAHGEALAAVAAIALATAALAARPCRLWTPSARRSLLGRARRAAASGAALRAASWLTMGAGLAIMVFFAGLQVDSGVDGGVDGGGRGGAPSTPAAQPGALESAARLLAYCASAPPPPLPPLSTAAAAAVAALRASPARVAARLACAVVVPAELRMLALPLAAGGSTRLARPAAVAAAALLAARAAAAAALCAVIAVGLGVAWASVAAVKAAAAARAGRSAARARQPALAGARARRGLPATPASGAQAALFSGRGHSNVHAGERLAFASAPTLAHHSVVSTDPAAAHQDATRALRARTQAAPGVLAIVSVHAPLQSSRHTDRWSFDFDPTCVQMLPLPALSGRRGLWPTDASPPAHKPPTSAGLRAKVAPRTQLGNPAGGVKQGSLLRPLLAVFLRSLRMLSAPILAVARTAAAVPIWCVRAATWPAWLALALLLAPWRCAAALVFGRRPS